MRKISYSTSARKMHMHTCISACIAYIRARATRAPKQEAIPTIQPVLVPRFLSSPSRGAELLINPFVCPQVGILELCGSTCAGSAGTTSARSARRVSTAHFCLCRCLGSAKLHFPSSHSILLPPFCRSRRLRHARSIVVTFFYSAIGNFF